MTEIQTPRPSNFTMPKSTAAGDVPARVQIHEVTRVTSGRVRLAIVARHDTPHIAEIGVYNEPDRR